VNKKIVPAEIDFKISEATALKIFMSTA